MATELMPKDSGRTEWLETGAVETLSNDDLQDMRRMGKEQRFHRNFKVVSITAFCLAAMMGFVFIPINSPTLIAAAGTGGAIILYLVNFFGFLTVVLCLAEMSSIAPTAGGQYHWVSEFAAPAHQRFLSYVSGWLSSIAWLVGNASGLFLTGQLIPATASLLNTGYVFQPWHGYLIVLACCLLSFSVNVFLFKYLPWIENIVLGVMMTAFIVVIAVLLTLSPKLSASEVFRTIDTGRGTTANLELVSAQTLIYYSLLGSDSTAHMAEETKHAAIVVPRAMVASYMITGIMNFVILIVFCFCFVDPDSAFNSPTGYPFLQVFETATGSSSGASGLASILIFLIMMSFIPFAASTSRQIFAFARDDGLPFSKFIARVSTRTGAPIYAVALVVTFIALISLIGLGSTVAFNAIVSLQIMALAGTYEVSLCCMIWRRLCGTPLPPSPWSLGRFGLPLNIIGAVYGLYALTFAAMPAVYPITPKDFNWGPVMFGGVSALSLMYYVVWARSVYKGPVVFVRQD